ncbi:hypothetical protein [Nocardia sp. NPDC051750]|uniref:hypothetical protein n=1 Tax=Nocardia sp. NPDC051750 TaxID=3364325 RepID=UPI00379B4D96
MRIRWSRLFARTRTAGDAVRIPGTVSPSGKRKTGWLTFAGAALATVIGATGCTSSSTPAQSADTTPSATTSLSYPGFLTADQQNTLAYRAELSSVDPCGFLAVDAISDIGTADYIGAGGAYETCTAHFSPPAGPQQIREILVRIGSSSGDYGTPVEGTPIRLSATPDLCTSYIPFDEARKVGLSYTVTAAGELTAAATGPREDLCPAARTVAEAGMRLAATRPQRSASPPFTENPSFPTHAQVNHPLATLDPCAVLGTLAAEAPALHFYPGPVGWGCNFGIDTDHTKIHHITYSYDYLRKALETRRYADDETRITVAGLPGVEKRSGQYASMKYCLITLATDPDAAAEDAEGNSLQGHLIGVSTDGLGCDAARRTAEAIATLYNAHCRTVRPDFPAMGRCGG